MAPEMDATIYYRKRVAILEQELARALDQAAQWAALYEQATSDTSSTTQQEVLDGS